MDNVAHSTASACKAQDCLGQTAGKLQDKTYPSWYKSLTSLVPGATLNATRASHILAY